MNEHDISEQAYKNGYEKGYEDGKMDAVKHGEWTAIEDDWTMDTIYQCSVCKEEFVTIDGTPADNLWHYCPHCGAKMDGDRQ